jgi:hypothetical protein
MNILDEAEQRADTAAKQGLSNMQAHIDALHDEIGREHHQQAKSELPKFERFVNTEVRPWLDKLARVQTRAKTPLPTEMQRLIASIHTECDQTPQVVRQALDEWNQLRIPRSQDSRSTDQHSCRELVAGMRLRLRNWDGKQSYIENSKARVEQYIKESGWPSLPVVAGVMSTVSASKPAGPIEVETAINLR